MSSQTIFVTKGSTNVTRDIGPILQDAGATNPGNPLTGLVYNDSGLICYYREGGTGTVTQLTLATQTVGGAHSDGGFVELSAGNMPGMYRLDLSDTIVSGSTNFATLTISGATDMAAHTVHIVLTDVDLYDGVRGGMTALPNAAADNAGGLPISDAGGLDLDAVLSGNIPQTGDSYARLGAPAGASVSADVAAVKTDTAAILLDTGTDGVVVASHTANSKSEINAEIVDALATDTYAELGAVPAATSTLADKINWLYVCARNKITQTSTTTTLRNDGDTGSIATSTTSDDGTTTTTAEWT